MRKISISGNIRMSNAGEDLRVSSEFPAIPHKFQNERYALFDDGKPEFLLENKVFYRLDRGTARVGRDLRSEVLIYTKIENHVAYITLYHDYYYQRDGVAGSSIY
ncbi:MAG: hypothetical protein AAGJ87_16265, partial [Pseudomonadota bacterium]